MDMCFVQGIRQPVLFQSVAVGTYGHLLVPEAVVTWQHATACEAGHCRAVVMVVRRNGRLLACAAGRDIQAQVTSVLESLPPQLDCVPTCYAVGLPMHHPQHDREFVIQLETTVTQMKQLLQHARLD